MQPRRVLTAEAIANINQRAVSPLDEPGAHESQREIARDVLGRPVSRTTVRNGIKAADLKPLRRVTTCALTATHRGRRVQLCTALLSGPWSAARYRYVVYSDEKLFLVKPPTNTRNNVLYVPTNQRKKEVDKDRLQVGVDAYSHGVMVWWALCWGQRVEPIFFPREFRFSAQVLLPALFGQTGARDSSNKSCKMLIVGLHRPSALAGRCAADANVGGAPTLRVHAGRRTRAHRQAHRRLPAIRGSSPSFSKPWLAGRASNQPKGVASKIG